MPARPTVVTGAAGFAGSHLLDLLEATTAGRSPLHAWHRPGHAPRSTSGMVQWRAVDVRQRDMVAGAIADNPPAQIYHLAALPHVGQAWADVVPHLETNILGTHYLLDAVRRTGLPCRMLIVSSALVYASSSDPIDESKPLKPATPYGVSKLAQEQVAIQSMQDGLEILIARPFNHVGPRQDPSFALSSFARQIAAIEGGRAEPVIRVGNLDTSRDISDVRDVVDAYARMMAGAATGRPYNVASGRAVRMRDLLDQLLQLSTARVRIEVDPALLRPTDPALFIGDASRIRAELGWQPTRPLHTTLGEMLEFWRRELTASSFA